MTDEAEVVGQEQLLLGWEARIRVLFNPAVWGGLVAAFGIGSLLLSALFFAISGSAWALAVGGGLLAGIMVIVVVVCVFIDLLGGFRTSFAITSHGVHSAAGKGAGSAADAAFWAGVLAGSTAAAGAGLLAGSEQNVFIPYGEVSAVKLRPGRRYIVVKGGFLQKPIGLYCTPENYPQAETILRQKCPAAKFA